MSSSDVDSLVALLDKTEQNIKRIEKISSEFVVPVLNEWRYATRHVFTFLQRFHTGDAALRNEEHRKATSHLKRAYFDSCDILIDCLLSKIQGYTDDYDCYIDIAKSYIPEYSELRKLSRKAWHEHAEANNFTADMREANYESLEAYNNALWEFLRTLDDNAAACDSAIRKKQRSETFVIVGIMATVIGAVAGILIPILMWIFKS